MLVLMADILTLFRLFDYMHTAGPKSVEMLVRQQHSR